MYNFVILLEAHLLSNQDVTHSLTDNVTHSSSGKIMQFMDRFGRPLQFCHLEFDKKAISGGFMEHFRVFTSGEGDEF